MHPATRRISTSVAVGIALLGLAAAPAMAGVPTPSSLKMASLTWEKAESDPTHCVFATSCGNRYWTAAGDDDDLWGYLDLNYGYVKGKAAAKHKVAEVQTVTADLYPVPAATEKYTYKFKAKGKKHKTKITALRYQDEGQYSELILSYDLIKKKNGKLKKRVPTSIMIPVQGVPGLGDKLHKKDGKLLKKQVRKLNKAAAKIPMSGPSNPIG